MPHPGSSSPVEPARTHLAVLYDAAHLAPELRVSHVQDERRALSRAILPDLVLEGVVQHEQPTLHELPPPVSHAHPRAWRYLQPVVLRSKGSLLERPAFCSQLKWCWDRCPVPSRKDGRSNPSSISCCRRGGAAQSTESPHMM